jgi:hypothetical protein
MAANFVRSRWMGCQIVVNTLTNNDEKRYKDRNYTNNIQYIKTVPVQMTRLFYDRPILLGHTKVKQVPLYSSCYPRNTMFLSWITEARIIIVRILQMFQRGG